MFVGIVSKSIIYRYRTELDSISASALDLYPHRIEIDYLLVSYRARFSISIVSNSIPYRYRIELDFHFRYRIELDSYRYYIELNYLSVSYRT